MIHFGLDKKNPEISGIGIGIWQIDYLEKFPTQSPGDQEILSFEILRTRGSRFVSSGYPEVKETFFKA